MQDDLALLGGPALFRFSDFPPDRVALSEQSVEAGVRALRSGAWSMFTSPEVSAFEEELGKFIGARHVVLVNSCTTAILASLMAADVRAGDYVAIPAYTYIGTCMPILALGARPVLVDIDLETQSMSVEALRKVMTTYPVRSVIHVNLFGLCAGASEIADLCRAHGASYVSDSAQFLGDHATTSRLAGEGAICFSFGESKILRLGEGGAVATNSTELAERMRLARHEGELWTRLNSSRLGGARPTPRDVISHLASTRQGLNFRPLSIAAALGRAMLKELRGHLDLCAANASALSAGLGGIPGIQLPHGQQRTWWTYPVRIEAHCIDRDLALAALLAEGVPAGVHFPRLLIEHPIVKESGALEPYETHQAREFACTHLVLPIYPRLRAGHMQSFCLALKKVLRNVEMLRSSEGRAQAERLLTMRPVQELCDGLFLFMAEAGEEDQRK